MSVERTAIHTRLVQTRGRGLVDVTGLCREVLAETGLDQGLCHVFIRHTSASLLITENADPDVQRDLETVFAGLGPDGDPRYRHTCEGPDDMASHIRSALTQTALVVPVMDGRLMLGTWQGIYLWEHRTWAHRRELVISLQP